MNQTAFSKSIQNTIDKPKLINLEQGYSYLKIPHFWVFENGGKTSEIIFFRFYSILRAYPIFPKFLADHEFHRDFIESSTILGENN